MKDKKYIFDGRFLLTSKKSGNLFKSQIKYFDSLKIDNAFDDYNDDINKTIPLMSTLEGKTLRPHFNSSVRSECKINIEYNSFDLCFINRLLM